MSELAKGAVRAHVLGGGSAALSPFAAFAGTRPVHANPRGRRARDVDGRCPPTVLLFAQVAAQTALADGEEKLRRMVVRLKANRDFCVAALREMLGITAPEPSGAFYVFPRIEGLEDSLAFSRRLLVEQRVGLAPGSAFGGGGEGSVRICYAAKRSVLGQALERLERFLRGGALGRGRS